jgi:HAD superfamily hydrolase (TIGR01509 family)
MIEAFIFDLDGTLVQTEPLRALSHARTALALSTDSFSETDVFEACREWVGLSHEETVLGLMQRFGLEEAARARMAEFGASAPWQVFAVLDRRFYAEVISDPHTVRQAQMPHALAVLRDVRRRGFQTGLATMSARSEVERVLAALGLAAAFDYTATCDDVERGKPAPEIFQIVARGLSVAPVACLVIEDSSAGVRAALAAGMECIAVPSGFARDPVDLALLLDPRWVVHDPSALAAVVEERLAKREGVAP